MMLFSAVFSVATSVGGYECPIYAKSVYMDVTLWKFSNIPQNYASMADAMTFIIILHSTFTGPFYGGVSVIGVLDFWLRKKCPPALLHASGYEM